LDETMPTNTTIEHELRALETEEETVFEWRRHVLRRAGYPGRLAFKLALRPDIDLHGAVRLLERGCPPETATRILL
jgi:hypothetical protein